MRAMTQMLVARHRAEIGRVAAALLVHETLGADAIDAMIIA
ncbi:hypothetical protein [Bradyrhizobium sp. JYMT SZCCT0180]|nr:hypothetical protein [Bradyrhizobium sp. JYMT SZCCT0180]